MELTFDGKIIYWRGPAPYYFIRVPDDQSAEIKAVANRVTYGWGVIPARVTIGETEFTTSLFPRQGGYLVPVRDQVRKAENLDLDDEVTLRLAIGR